MHIHKGKLTISLLDPRLREIANRAGSNLYLDATINPLDLNMMLASEVFIVKQSGDLAMPSIYQIMDMGRMTMQRGNEQVRKVKEIVNHLRDIDPSTKAIDFKKFADGIDDNAHSVDGVWFRDSRGSNDFKEAKTLVITGTPCPNLSALRSEYVTLTGLQSQENDPAFANFIDRRILANIQQCFGRKSGNRFRDGDKIYFLSDFDLGDLPHNKTAFNRIGYAGDSSIGQNLDSQIDPLQKVGFIKILQTKYRVLGWIDQVGLCFWNIFAQRIL